MAKPTRAELREKVEWLVHGLRPEDADAITEMIDAYQTELEAAEAKNTRLSALIVEQEAEYRKEKRAAEARCAELEAEALAFDNVRAAYDDLIEERDALRAANHSLVRINGGLRGLDDPEDDHWCAVEGCQNKPTMYEFQSDEFVCDEHVYEHVYYGAVNPETEKAEKARDALAGPDAQPDPGEIAGLLVELARWSRVAELNGDLHARIASALAGPDKPADSQEDKP